MTWIKAQERIRNCLIREDGSAIIEFIILALPLFIPMAVYLSSVNQNSNISYDARNFAREVARVYASTSLETDIAPRIAQLTQSYGDNVFLPNKIALPPLVEVSCESQPCLTPGSRISVEVTLKTEDGKFQAHATNVQTVDAWRSSTN